MSPLEKSARAIYERYPNTPPEKVAAALKGAYGTRYKPQDYHAAASRNR